MAELILDSTSTPNVYLRIKSNNSCDKCYTVLNAQEFKVSSPNEEKSYRFSHIFPSHSPQDEIFAKSMVSPLKQFLGGTNCLIVSYGTTNAGKTYSIQGNNDNPGIVPRAINYVLDAIGNNIETIPEFIPDKFDHVVEHKEKCFVNQLKTQLLRQCQVGSIRGLQFGSDTLFLDKKHFFDTALCGNAKFSLWMSMLEIYNDCCYDLLSTNGEKGKIKIRECENVFFPAGLTEIHVSTKEEALCLLQHGWQKRIVKKTFMNENSSRSHGVVRLRLIRTDTPKPSSTTDNKNTQVSTFFLCDLAGIERSSKAGFDDRAGLQETANINSTMLVLGKCFQSLMTMGADHELHRKIVVPYRENELTKLLQPMFQVQGPKNILININTSTQLLEETKNVLTFSQTVGNVNLLPKINSLPSTLIMERNNIVKEDIATLAPAPQTNSQHISSEIQQLKNDIKKLKNELAQMEDIRDLNDALLTRNAGLSRNVDSCSNDIEKLRELLSEARKDGEQWKSEAKKVRREANALQLLTDNLRAENVSLVSRVTVLEHCTEKSKNNQDEEDREQNQSHHDYEKLKEKYKSVKQQLSMEKEKVDKISKTLKNAQEKVKEQKNIHTTLQDTLATIRTTNRDHLEQWDVLQNYYSSQNQILKEKKQENAVTKTQKKTCSTGTFANPNSSDEDKENMNPVLEKFTP